jgi:hypothetical protein
MRPNKILLIGLLGLTLQTGCMYAIRYDGTYRGKVVDADTREPIEGVVVLGTWSELHPNPGGGYHTYYDARETVTDKDGGFSIKGQGLRIMSNLEPMGILIFKAGYSYEQESWDSLKTGLYSKERIKWEDDKPIFPLKKLTMEDRKRQSVPDPITGAPKSKIKLMVNEINKDRVTQGLGTIDPGR